jgi:hypothetical protein
MCTLHPFYRVYFATNATKSARYVQQGGGGQGMLLLVCEIAVGKQLVCTSLNPSLDARSVLGMYDSAFAPRGAAVMHDEYICFHPHQARPAYVVKFEKFSASTSAAAPAPFTQLVPSAPPMASAPPVSPAPTATAHASASTSAQTSASASAPPTAPAAPTMKTRPVWEQDNDVKSCRGCSQYFGMLARRHHCRMCGKIYCGRCCAHKQPLPELEYHKAERVCKICVGKLRISA